MAFRHDIVIRGITAPASLKRTVFGLFLREALRYPGHNCPGLIEAGPIARIATPNRHRYPGHNCPGLIEAPDHGSRNIHILGSYPGHNCPGLIEAFRQLERFDL
ncbi:protein of unknown function [Candidatus Methylocalor cossyra]|uniref:Uncharacterized protein n=1 Tax=Candidatus Methylocalor cossyra TaxID=3108543 RepID=A0ABM9NLF2_9GAMM